MRQLTLSLLVLALGSLACMQTTAASSGAPAPKPTLTAASLAPSATATESAGSCKVIALEALNLRSGAGIDYSVIGWLSPGELLTLTNTPARGVWIEVITETGAKGWINSNYCER